MGGGGSMGMIAHLDGAALEVYAYVALQCAKVQQPVHPHSTRLTVFVANWQTALRESAC
jgi:hypothetical protein